MKLRRSLKNPESPAMLRAAGGSSREQKITLGTMGASGVRGLLIYCFDYKCSHSVRVGADHPIPLRRYFDH